MSKNKKLLVNYYNETEIEKDLLAYLMKNFDNVETYTDTGKDYSIEELKEKQQLSFDTNDVIINIITPKTITSIIWLLHVQHQQNFDGKKEIINCFFGGGILADSFKEIYKKVNNPARFFTNNGEIYNEQVKSPMRFLTFHTISEYDSKKAIEKTKNAIGNDWYVLKDADWDDYHKLSEGEDKKELYKKLLRQDLYKSFFKEFRDSEFENLVENLEKSKLIRIDEISDFQKVYQAIV